MNDRDKMRRPHEFTDATGNYGEQDPPGENQGIASHFTAEQVAVAFGVDIQRIYSAFDGEFQLGSDASVNSRQAQDLAEVVLGDRVQAEREEALMRLGAFTPRRDTIAPSVSEKPPGELSDRLRPSEEVPDLGVPKERDR